MIAARLLIWTMLPLALVGCAVTPDYHPPETAVPAAWSQGVGNGQAASREGAPWWTSFADPVLDALIERAVRANLDLELARARVREARAREGGVAGARRPSLEARSSYAYERESGNAPSPVLVRPGGEVEAPGHPEHLFQAGFDASWELDLFGGVRRAGEAARADHDAAVYDLRDVLVSLVAEVCRNYLELRSVQQQSCLARQSFSAQQDALSLLRSRYEAGMTTDLEVTHAEAELQRAAGQLPAHDVSYKKALHRLGVLLGQPPDALAGELAPERPVAVPTLLPTLGLPSDLLRQRPDIRSAERHVAAASARLGAATADLYPRFSLAGTLGLASVAAGDFFNGTSALWSVGPSITWPILQGGRVVANIEVRDAQQQQALIAYRRAILNAIEEVENAISGYRGDQTQRAALGGAVEAQKLSVALARERYLAGLTDFREVLDAQRALFQAQSELAQVDSALLLDLVALYKALGGGWNVLVPEDRRLPVQGGAR